MSRKEPERSSEVKGTEFWWKNWKNRINLTGKKEISSVLHVKKEKKNPRNFKSQAKVISVNEEYIKD